MKKKFIVLFMAILIISNFYGCNKKAQDLNEGKQNYETMSEEIQGNDNDELQVDGRDNKASGIINTDGIMQEDSSGDVTSSETKKVGKERYGFVEVPSYWKDFKDVDLPSDTTVIQYSDPSGSSIITMDVTENYEHDIENTAQQGAQIMQNEGASVEGARVSIGGYEAYQVYGYYENDGTILVAWYFKDENNALHYVSAEGTLHDVSDVVEYVEKTYSLN